MLRCTMPQSLKSNNEDVFWKVTTGLIGNLLTNQARLKVLKVQLAEYRIP